MEIEKKKKSINETQFVSMQTSDQYKASGYDIIYKLKDRSYGFVHLVFHRALFRPVKN